ncbi:MAG: hypothetical protein IPM39_25305 [Chloroflexi bacterium]|nr:hypothetical protein [Chloroflexota bacterium]
MGDRRLIGGWAFVLVAGLLVGLLAACTAKPDLPQTAVGRNGLPVAAEFLPFYQEYGGRRILGDPISELFVAEENGRSLQYFQNVRLEYDAATGQIVVTPLGVWALEGLREPIPALTPGSPAQPSAGAPYPIQDEFFTFYSRYSGDTLLGPAMSPQLNADDLRVQYFANGRLEWRPEAPTDLRVQLSPLGQAHFDSEMRFIYQESRDARPVSSAGVSMVVLNAYVKAPILYGGETQTLYVTAQTPGGDPVTGLPVDLTLTYGENSQTIALGSTNDNGQITYPLAVPVPPGEQVSLRLYARGSDGRIIGETVVTYKTWW